MEQSDNNRTEPAPTLDGLIRARLQAVQAPPALRERIRALIALEIQGDISSDSQWRV